MLSSVCLFEHALYHIGNGDNPLPICNIGTAVFLSIAVLGIFLITKKYWK